MKCSSYDSRENYLRANGVCLGTKEQEPCVCGGDEKKCDFYPEKREKKTGKTIVHCNVKENAELIAKILDYDVDNEEYKKCGSWVEWWPGDCALIMTGEEMLYMCSECESKHIDKSNFCPNCGADMRGKNDD